MRFVGCDVAPGQMQVEDKARLRTGKRTEICNSRPCSIRYNRIGLWLHDRFGVRGLAIIGVLGEINIPYYEEMARRIHWWTYRGCRMVSNTPNYIIVGELGIAITITLLARPLRRGGWKTVLLTGVAGGAASFVCYVLAFGLTDGFARSP